LSVPFFKNHEGKLAAIAILVIVIPSFAAGCISGGDENGPTTLSLSVPDMDKRPTNAGDVWDVTFDILKVTTDEADVRWVHMTVMIKDSSGSVLLQETPLSKDSGFYGSAVEAWYVERGGDANAADEGDAIKITGMSRMYQVGQVTVRYRGATAATATLPLIF
jgi:hypothetical protein